MSLPWLATLAIFAVVDALGANQPQQVHLALGSTPDQVTIQWTTMERICDTSSIVAYGTDANDLKFRAFGSNFSFQPPGAWHRSMIMHVVHIRGLSASTRYYYRVMSNDTLMTPQPPSSPFSFRTIPDAQTVSQHLPMTFAIYGDQGLVNEQSLSKLLEDAETFTMVYHVGDFAYDLESDQGIVGDDYMNSIQPLAANVPYMVCHGNHEASYDFHAYTFRFANQPVVDGDLHMPHWGTRPNNWWFSWNVGLVHFVTISTEVYWFKHPKEVERQYEWLKHDLMMANLNRSAAPWIIVGGHRPMYCSCDGDCDGASLIRDGVWDGHGHQRFGLEELFYKYGVDVFIAGHEHNYERMYDVSPEKNTKDPWLSGKTTQSNTNPPGPIHVVTGSAGCREFHEAFQRPAPPRTAFRSNTFGYSRMYVHNRTHILWEQVMTDDGQPMEDMGKVIDSVWWVQERHGPFGGRNVSYDVSEYKEPITMDVVAQRGI